ncbi:MAG: hercynine metabolism protein [Prochlorococcaceae cyanobacterium]|jgi:hercynine metabolism protein
MSASWFDDLEARLEQQLDAFLRANPEQEARLAEQESLERREELRRRRLTLTARAERCRQELLQLAGEIRQWQERTERARQAGATELAERAARHGEELMDQGRRRWEELAALGQDYAATEAALEELGQSQGRPQPPKEAAPATSPASDTLEADWASFEAGQELEALKRRRSGNG